MANDPKYEEFDFAEWLSKFGLGMLNKQAGVALRKLMLACQEAGKTGQLQITFKAGALDGLGELKASIKVVLPQAGTPSGSYFVTETGALVTEDPKQLKLGGGKVLDIPPVRSIKDRDPL